MSKRVKSVEQQLAEAQKRNEELRVKLRDITKDHGEQCAEIVFLKQKLLNQEKKHEEELEAIHAKYTRGEKSIDELQEECRRQKRKACFALRLNLLLLSSY
jgi:predicted  nucleic acid-binding Zn-ribbon protein